MRVFVVVVVVAVGWAGGPAARADDGPTESRSGDAVVIEVVKAVPAQVDEGPKPITIVLRTDSEERAVKLRKALRASTDPKVTKIEVLVGKPRQAAVTAVMRANDDVPHKVVVAALEALKAAGVREVHLMPAK